MLLQVSLAAEMKTADQLIKARKMSEHKFNNQVWNVSQVTTFFSPLLIEVHSKRELCKQTTLSSFTATCH